jgi:hypothetical protein
MTSDETPAIVLAGREWPIPRLAPKQNRIVVPALLELIPRILGARAQADAAGETGQISQLARTLDTAFYDRLGDVVFTALTRAEPGLTRTAFDDMAIDTLELLVAVRVIALQAGLLKQGAR